MSGRWLLAACAALCCGGAAAAAQPPNVVLIFADDLGYGDLGCYGGAPDGTPHLDRLAEQGVRCTDFYVPQPVCTSSRAALLTGCYPNRVGLVGALGPQADYGIHADETTLAEALQAKGYATACFGKWHLGHHPRFLPLRHGFDEYFGLPYSNDMGPQHPTARNFPDLPLISGEAAVELNPDQSQLTALYTERAVEFIAARHAEPFFLYVAHSMPHVPLFVSERHRGATQRGLYADVLAEIDWSVGQILAALTEHGLEERTLVLFTSDNGPWLLYGDHAGSAGPLREGKGTNWEGGVRVPFLARFPGRIPAGSTCTVPLMTIDVLPTVVRLADAPLPQQTIDGRDMWPALSGQPGAVSPHEALYFYWLNELHALRAGRWKLHLPHASPQPAPPGGGGVPGKYQKLQTGLELYDLEADIGESVNLADQHADVVQELLRLAELAREELGDSLSGRIGAGVRPPGK